MKNSFLRNSQKIKLRQDDLQAIFSGRVDIFYPPQKKIGLFSSQRDFFQTRLSVWGPYAPAKLAM